MNLRSMQDRFAGRQPKGWPQALEQSRKCSLGLSSGYLFQREERKVRNYFSRFGGLL